MSGGVPNPLKSARRQLGSLPEVLIPADWRWDDSASSWCLHIQVNLEVSKLVPKSTQWEILVDDKYPKGFIGVYPSLNGGIEDTFPHQSNNSLKPKGKFARSGKLCLFSPEQEAAIPDDENFKLVMHVEKALEWVNAANENTLLKDGDYLEFPDYKEKLLEHPSLVYYENEVSKLIWDSHPEMNYGIAELFSTNKKNLAVSKFLNPSSTELAYSIDWGEALNRMKSDKDVVQAIWIRLKTIPKVKTWQAPNTFSELREVISCSDLSFDEIVGLLSHRLRDGQQKMLLLGFPVAQIVGEKPDRLAWQGLLLPKFTEPSEMRTANSSSKVMKKRLENIDKVRNMASSKSINWVKSDNWAPEEILSRGHYSEELIDKSILLIGAGSLGSMISELLVRGGVSEIGVSDYDIFEAGNTSRHTLTANDIGYSKALCITERLLNLRPGVEAKSLKFLSDENVNIVNDYKVIIDCTSSTDVLRVLSDLKKTTALFFTFSFSYEADLLYCAASPLTSFSLEEYQKRFESIMLEEIKSRPFESLPWKGIGCWSPVFPARASDVARAAAFAVDFIDFCCKKEIDSLRCCFYKICKEDGLIDSFERIDL